MYSELECSLLLFVVCFFAIVTVILYFDISFSVSKVENIRRKHNYLPLIMELLKILANNGQLVSMVEKV